MRGKRFSEIGVILSTYGPIERSWLRRTNVSLVSRHEDEIRSSSEMSVAIEVMLEQGADVRARTFTGFWKMAAVLGALVPVLVTTALMGVWSLSDLTFLIGLVLIMAVVAIAPVISGFSPVSHMTRAVLQHRYERWVRS